MVKFLFERQGKSGNPNILESGKSIQQSGDIQEKSGNLQMKKIWQPSKWH